MSTYIAMGCFIGLLVGNGHFRYDKFVRGVSPQEIETWSVAEETLSTSKPSIRAAMFPISSHNGARLSQRLFICENCVLNLTALKHQLHWQR